VDVTKHDEIDDCNKANITVVETLHPTSRRRLCCTCSCRRFICTRLYCSV